MKKRICFILLLFLFLAVLSSQVVAASAASDINVSIDGENILFVAQAPAIVDGRTLVPVRTVFEALGFDVWFAEKAQTVILTGKNDRIVISLGKNRFNTNGIVHTLDVPAQIINGHTMLPIRAVLESVGYYVGWEPHTSTVTIISPPPDETEPIPEPDPPLIPSPPVRQMTIPNRRLTDTEVADWINAYNVLGAASDFEREVIRLTNLERAAFGVSPLEEGTSLMMAARFKSQSMYDLDYFSHTSPVYGHFTTIAREVFAVPMRAMGENLASGHRTPEEVVQGWMDSPGHRTNLLKPEFTCIGVGFYNFRWTQKLTS